MFYIFTFTNINRLCWKYRHIAYDIYGYKEIWLKIWKTKFLFAETNIRKGPVKEAVAEFWSEGGNAGVLAGFPVPQREGCLIT